MRNFEKLASMTILCALISACASQEKRDEPILVPTSPLPTVNQVDDETIDVLGLQRSLGLEKNFDDLGFEERPFDTCAAGYGFPASRNCRQKSFVLVQFRLQCRDSEGTVQSADYQLTPIVSDRVKWNLGKAEGMTSTDTAGYGTFVYIAGAPQAQAKLRLTVNGKFLIMTAGEIRRVVVPGNWCAAR